MKLKPRSRRSSLGQVQAEKIDHKIKKEGKFNLWIWAKTHKLVSALLIILIILSGAGVYIVNKLQSSGINVNAGDIGKTIFDNLPGTAAKANPLEDLDKTNNRTNVLVIGVDARNVQESLNTDTIMLLSYDHAKNQTAQISFPRDLRVDYTINNKKYSAKINSVFPTSYSINKSYDKATEDLGKAVETISGLPVHYAVIVDFQAFKKIIDSVGGVDINVENSFCDAGYPTDDYKTQYVRFSKGQQHMDGDTALKYARSRVHDMCRNESAGDPEFEGNDFMRAKRQQKVVAAVKEKLMNSNLLTKANAISELLSTLGENIHLYKIGIDDITNAVQAKDKLNSLVFFSMVIDPSFGPSDNSYLIGKMWDDDGAYEVRPTGKNSFTEVKSAIQNYLDNSFLLIEKPNAYIVTTAKNSYQRLLNLQGLMDDTDIPYNVNYYMINIAATPTPSISTTSIVSPTATPANQNKISVYILDSKLTESQNYLKTKLTAKGYTVEIKTKEEVPTELQRFESGKNFILALE